MVSGGRRRGDTRLFRDRDVLTSGLVGVRLPGAHSVSVVSQGCRPIGEPYIVTGADGAVITELGGRPPLHRLREIVLGMAPDERNWSAAACRSESSSTSTWRCRVRATF
ncbi:Uncharacterized protein conserved in bacteria [Mycobacterium tuberculosis]|nr:Uncharacterized protein conserved in bacteria [Mycobacterium tuberculosis]